MCLLDVHVSIVHNPRLAKQKKAEKNEKETLLCKTPHQKGKNIFQLLVQTISFPTLHCSTLFAFDMLEFLYGQSGSLLTSVFNIVFCADALALLLMQFSHGTLGFSLHSSSPLISKNLIGC